MSKKLKRKEIFEEQNLLGFEKRILSMSQSLKCPFSFKKLICNLLLNNHPICTDRFMHQLLANTIYKYYLNFRTFYMEIKTTEEHDVKVKKLLTMDEALIFAIEHNYVYATWLLKNGANVSVISSDMLRYAVGHNEFRTVKLILTYKADLDVDYALSLAADNGNFIIVRLLLEYGADANVLSSNGYPLCVAARNGYIQTIKILLEYKSIVHIDENNDALVSTTNNGHTDAVHLLLNAGVNSKTHINFFSPLF